MSKKTKKLFRDGKFVRYLDDSENYYCRDKESIHVSMEFMDGLDPMQRLVVQDSMTPSAPRHAPGYVVQLSDSEQDDRAQRYYDRKQQLADAWKSAPPLAAASEPAKPAVHQQPLTADADAAYERRNAALERAYLGGA